MPFFLILPQFVRLLESWPKKILLLTDFPWSAALKCSHSLLFCHSSWNESGFCLPASLDLMIRVKTWGCLCAPSFLCPGMFWASCIPVPRVELLIFLFISKGGSKSSVLVGLCARTPTPTPSSGARKGLVPHCLLGLAVVPAAADLGVRILN